MSDNLFKRGEIWWGRVQFAGRDIKRSLRTRSRAEARRRLEAWLTDVERARWTGEARHTFKEAVVKWTEEVLPSSVKPSVAKRYLTSIRAMDPHFSALHIDEIDAKQVARFVSARARGGATNATIRRDLTALSSLLKAAKAWTWIDRNPAAEYDRDVIRERRDPIQPPSDEAVEEMIRRCPPALGRMVRFLAQTGMRQEEAASLTWAQVDTQNGTIQLIKTKTSRPRLIDISLEALGTLTGTPRHMKSPYVFWHDDGARYLNVASRFAAICAGRPGGSKRSKPLAALNFRCHDLRHRYAIEELRAGRDIYDLSKHLGHSSVKTTEIYLGYVSRRPEQKPEHMQRSGTGESAGGELSKGKKSS